MTHDHITRLRAEAAAIRREQSTLPDASPRRRELADAIDAVLAEVARQAGTLRWWSEVFTAGRNRDFDWYHKTLERTLARAAGRAATIRRLMAELEQCKIDYAILCDEIRRQAGVTERLGGIVREVHDECYADRIEAMIQQAREGREEE